MPGNTSGQTGAGSTAPSTQPPAFETALAASRRRASRQKAVFVLAVCAIGAGATMFRRMSRRRESIRAVGAAWDRYSRCLVGAPLAPGETARARLLQMELTLPEAAGSTDKQDWPLRCSPAADQVRLAIGLGQLESKPAFHKLSVLAARASAADATTWSEEPDLANDLWSAAQALDLPSPSRSAQPVLSPPLPGRALTAASLPALPLPTGSTGEPQPSPDPNKVVIAFSRPHTPGANLCAFGPGAHGEPLGSAHCEDGAGVLRERQPRAGAFVRTALDHFDRFELVRPRVDKEPWRDALDGDTRAAALFGDQLVYVKPGPHHPDLLFARTARLDNPGEEPLADPVPLGELDGRAHEFATCATPQALVLRVRSYDERLAADRPGQSRAHFAFYADGQWSHAPTDPPASNAAQLTCRAHEGTLSWVEGEAVAQVRCDPDGCSEQSSGPLVHPWTHMQRLAAGDLDGSVLLVGIADGSGPFSAALVHSVRMRLAPIDKIATAPDIVLWGDGQHGGADPAQVHLLVGQGAAVVIVTTQEGANRAIRVDPAGRFEPVEIAKD